MFNPKEFPAVQIVTACAIAASAAGQKFDASPVVPAKQVLSIAISSSTTSAAITFNPMTFAKIDPPPPVVPPGDRQQQG